VFVPLPPDVDPEGRFAQFNISKSDWRTFADFMAVSNMDLMLGLNQITRRWPNGQKCTGERGACPWDSTNARAFMEHNRDAGIPVWGYELGNEPGCYMARDDQPTFSKSLGITCVTCLLLSVPFCSFLFYSFICAWHAALFTRPLMLPLLHHITTSLLFLTRYDPKTTTKLLK
jgi:hypothetical protein